MTQGPTHPSQRFELIGALRGFALFGVLLVKPAGGTRLLRAWPMQPVHGKAGLGEPRPGALEVCLGHPGVAEHERDVIGRPAMEALGRTDAHAACLRLGQQGRGGAADRKSVV